MSISIHFASASCSRILRVQLAAIESSVVSVLHTWLLDGDFKLFFMPAKVSLDRVCLLCTSVTKSCTALQSTPSPGPSLSGPYMDTSLCDAIAMMVGHRKFADLSEAKGDTAQSRNFCQAFREMPMVMLVRNSDSLPDGKCVGRTLVDCKAEATGLRIARHSCRRAKRTASLTGAACLQFWGAVYWNGSQACRTRRMGTSCIITCSKVRTGRRLSQQ